MHGPSPLCPRGSEWRRWDLQIHTPFSALNNGFGQDFDHYAKTTFESAVSKSVAVIGVTDYFSVDGYRALRAIQHDEAKLLALLGDQAKADAVRGILLLPNIELRTPVVVTRPNRPDARVNLHVIFSNELTPDELDENFLRELRFTAESSPGGPDDEHALTTANLAKLGKRLKQEHSPFAGMPDVFVGMMNAVVSHEKITATLNRQETRFKERYLLVTPADEDLSECSWNGQAHLTRKLYIQKSHMLFSSNAGTRAFGLGERHPTVEAFLGEFKTRKPCIHGSDAHTYADLFEPAEDRFLWVKADPTFLGLRQVLYEPDERVFIGAVPPSVERVAARPTKVMRSLKVTKAPHATLSEKWFDCGLDLNAELIAIIGNKGSGKSALSDVLGLLGNTPRFHSFGFLRADRFCDPKLDKAKHFEATLTWADATADGPTTLDSQPEQTAVEKVRYIPQNYLEEICNEVGLGRDSRFYSELQQVIFSHVPKADREEFETLDELLEHRGEEINRGINILANELSQINQDVVAHEVRLSPKHRKGIEGLLAEKRREAEAHEQTKPVEVAKPEADETILEQARQAAQTLEARQEALQRIEKSIRELEATDARLAKKRTAAERLASKLRNLQRQVDTSLAEAASDLTEIGLQRDQIVTFEVHSQPIDAVIGAVDAERLNATNQLNAAREGGLGNQRATVLKEIEALQESLTAPQRAYQAYLLRLKEWQSASDALQGEPEEPGTIAFLEKGLKELDHVPASLRRLQRTRRRKTLEILKEKQRLQEYYEGYYGAVQTFLEKHRLAAKGAFKVTFTVTMAQSGFSEQFLGQINRRKLGAFAGVDEGAERVKALLDVTNWNSGLSVTRFCEGLVRRLKESPGGDRELHEQLLHSDGVGALYDSIFALGYLAPIYRLTWDGKGLEQLSPGERGNLLLIFYLLVDRDDIPLIIDQPEENLDNQTVVKTLVPCIQDAKRRRQIVMVTHNPNLAVVCDAEQVVYAEMRKEHNNEVTYISGSIEDPTINLKIVDVLEGTRPAFDQRDARYQP